MRVSLSLSFCFRCLSWWAFSSRDCALPGACPVLSHAVWESSLSQVPRLAQWPAHSGARRCLSRQTPGTGAASAPYLRHSSVGAAQRNPRPLHQVAFKGVALGTDPGPSTTSSEAGWPEGTPGIRAISGGVLNARVPCLLADGAGLAPALITPGPACTAPTETSLPSCVLAAVTCHPFTLIPFWSQASAHQFWIRMGKRECGGAGEGQPAFWAAPCHVGHLVGTVPSFPSCLLPCLSQEWWLSCP